MQIGKKLRNCQKTEKTEEIPKEENRRRKKVYKFKSYRVEDSCNIQQYYKTMDEKLATSV